MARCLLVRVATHAMLAHLHALFEARELLYDDEYVRLLCEEMMPIIT